MTNEEAIKILQMYKDEMGQRIDKANAPEVKDVYQWQMDGFDMAIDATKQTAWIPIKYHEITEIERKENGYPKDWVYFLDCEMPQDGQEILVQAKNGEIRWDVCYEDDGFSLDSGWDWKDDIIAWMPLPEPYKGGEDND